MKSIFLLLSLVSGLTLLAREEAVVLKTTNGDIYGTLTLPETEEPCPVILLIAGSGPTDRDGNNPSMKNNSLKMLAGELAEKGFASVRYDKRGIAQSAASGKKEADLRFEDYAKDAQGWIHLLKEDKRFSRIIIAGHSEGSLIGMMATKGNPAVSKFISLAGPGESAGKVLRRQLSAQPQPIPDLCFPIIEKLEKGELVNDAPILLYSLFRPSVQPYLISWLKYDPAAEISHLKIPVLIIQGTTDIQVEEKDADLLASACPGAQKKIIPGMNHVLKECLFTDKLLQMPTYNNPELALHADLVNVITAFILP